MIDWLKRTAIAPQIELNGETVPIIVTRRKRAKRLTLRLAPDGSEVRISLPTWAHGNEAIAFAHARAQWLAGVHASIPRRAAPDAGEEVLYRARPLTITWQAQAPRRPAVRGAQLVLGGSRESLASRIRAWLEREGLALFEADMAEYCAAAGLDPVPVALSRAQRRWGSCSDMRRIRINWRLVQAPDFVRRSVVAHEVAHLVHFDHSPAFHALLGRIFEDDIGEADRWLKQNGRSLYASFG